MKKYNEWKKTFAFTFALAIAGNSMPVFAGTSVYAEEAVEEPTETSSETEVLIDSGTCGELASYELDANGVLSVSGEGAVTDGAFKADTFAYADKVQELRIADTITALGAEAFAGLSALEFVTLPADLTTIGDGAFRDCTMFEVIDMPRGVTYIGEDAFKGCTELHTMYLYTDPENLTWLDAGSDDFRPDKETYVVVNVRNKEKYENTFSTHNVTFVSYLDDGACGEHAEFYLGHDGSLYIEGTGEVDASCFTKENFPHWDEVEQVYFGGGITGIGEDAFVGFTSIKLVSMPESMTSVGKGAFRGCTSMLTLYLDADPAEFSWEDFDPSSMILPGDDKEIGITVLKDDYEPYLERFSAPNITVMYMLDQGSFENGPYYAAYSSHELSFAGYDIIPADSFSGYAFADEIETICIFSDIIGIGANAFSGFQSLKKVEMHTTDFTEIGEGAFSDCTALTTFQVPETLTSIGANAFAGCTSLTDFDLPCDPETLTIGENAFSKETVFHVDPSALEQYQARFPDLQFAGDLSASEDTADPLPDDTLTQWALVDYEKKNGIAVNAEITARTDDAYEITLTNADGVIVDVYSVDPRTAVGVNQTNAEINLPQTGVTSPGALAAAAGAFAAITVGAAVMLGSGVFRRRKENSEP